MEIPVYGLSGIDTTGEVSEFVELNGLFSNIAKKIKKSATYSAGQPALKIVGADSNSTVANAVQKALSPTFTKHVSKIKNSVLRNKKIAAHKSIMRGIEGIYNVSASKIANGTATQKESVDFKKARILLQLEGTDYDSFRLASIYMPYVVDIDERDGGYIFDNAEMAGLAAWGEEEFIKIVDNPHHTEAQLEGFFSAIKKAVKSVGNAVKNTVKTVGNAVKNTATTAARAVTSTVKNTISSAVNVTKSAANLVKSGVQAATGNTKAAKETLQKAGQQLKAGTIDATKNIINDTIVNPAKTAVTSTVSIAKQMGQNVKDGIKIAYELGKEVVTIAGKVFKVLFLKLNPITILIRSSLRALCSLNFRGMATKLGVGLLTQKEAEKQGFSRASWESAVNSLKKFKKLFEKMGGTPSKLEKSIRNGATKKPLFGAKKNQKITFKNGDDGETGLGDPATIAALVAACASTLITVFNWIKGIVQEKKAKEEQKKEEQKQEEQKKYNQEHYETDAYGNLILDHNGQAIPKGTFEKDKQAAQQQAAATQATEEKKKKNLKTGLIIAGVGGAALLAITMLGGNKKKKRR